MYKLRFCVLAGLLLLALMPAVSGQDELFPANLSHFQFNFLNPGGRSTAMGGAFIAQGNDATGSETNPAGLLFIPKPMLFAEYRYFRHTVSRPYSATDTEIVNRTFTDPIHSPTFLSVVYPKGKWAFAFYRQELANFTARYANADMMLPGTQNQNYIVNRQSIFLDFNLVNYGFTLARRLHETLAAGISVRAAHMDFQMQETVNLDRGRETPPFFPRLNINTDPPDGVGNFAMMDDDDWKISYVIGVQYKPNDYISLAGVYRSGEEHKLQAVFFDNVLKTNVPPDQRSLRKAYEEFRIDVPVRIGFGLSLTPHDRWAVNFDAVHIRYADLNSQFLELLQASQRQYFGWENGTEYRAGAEYVLPVGKANSVAFRAGYYSTPDPSIHYLGGADTAPGTVGYINPILFPAVGTVHHATFGLGLVMFKNFQLDLAGDLSKDKDYFVISAMYNFGS